MARIVLAHGILGFGSVLPPHASNYFNGIYQRFHDEGHDVARPIVPALGSIAARSASLEAQIRDTWPNDAVPLYLLAHSMGGLDCRHMLLRTGGLEGRVRRLITVATPHYGSPVADLVPPPLFPALPLLAPGLGGFLAANLGAVADLRTRDTLHDDDAPGVDYVCVGCDMGTTQPKSPFFAATALAGGLGTHANDGLVSLASASRTHVAAQLSRIWPVDHGGAIGWPSGGTQAAQAALAPPADHLARYMDLLAALLA